VVIFLRPTFDGVGDNLSDATGQNVGPLAGAPGWKITLQGASMKLAVIPALFSVGAAFTMQWWGLLDRVGPVIVGA
jgi:hypothetical protein